MASETFWVSVCAAAELAALDVKTVRAHGQTVAVFRAADGAIYAVDNRCPHEGYPLSQGYVRDCVLTCAWHNFKFDLRDGSCLVGDEHLRTFPVRIVDEKIEVEIRPLDPNTVIPSSLDGLRTAILERKIGQAARDVIRLAMADMSAETIFAHGLAVDALHGEYGLSHAMAVAADALEMVQRYPGAEMVVPILPAFDIASEAVVRRPPRPTAAPIAPVGDPVSTGEKLREAVEAEDAAKAEGILRGALAAGWGREIVEPWLWQLCADHFLDFGHAQIYQSKIFDFIDRIGAEFGPDLLAAHLVGIVYGTREETLPPWSKYREVMDAAKPRYVEFLRRQPSLPPALATAVAMATPKPAPALALAPVAKWDGLAFRECVLEGKAVEVGQELTVALGASVPVSAIIDELSVAAAERLLRFDVAIDFDATVQDAWLDVTHRLTAVNALRAAWERFAGPDVLRLIYMTARFVNVARAYDLPVAQRFSTAADSADTRDADALRTAIVTAIRARQTQLAITATATYCAQDFSLDALAHTLDDFNLRESAVRPIVIGHCIKTTVAAFDEARRVGRWREWPILAAVRFLASPKAERRLSSVTSDALSFVRDGRPPRRLVD